MLAKKELNNAKKELNFSNVEKAMAALTTASN